MDQEKIKELTHLALRAALTAGQKILSIYEKAIQVSIKEDGSPLTEADRASHEIILNALSQEGFPVMSEEGKEIPFNERRNWEYYWLVDPLDGTKEFIKRNGEFTVNIAFMKYNSPVAGVIYQPTKKCGLAGMEGIGVFKFCDGDDLKFSEDNRVSPNGSASESSVKVIASRTHQSAETDSFIKDLESGNKNVELLNAGSALKFCLLAEGYADVYPRFAPTMEWDTAAGHAILKSLGRNIYVYPEGVEMKYNKPKLINDWFIAR